MSSNGLQIPPSKNIDPGQLVKKNEKLKQIFQKHKVFDKPHRVQCWKVVPDKVNRGGQPPNIHYIHENLEPKLEDDGFDEMRRYNLMTNWSRSETTQSRRADTIL